MANFTATSTVTEYETLSEAVAGLETKLEAIVDTGVIRACDVIPLRNGKFAAYVVWTAAV